MGMFDRIRTQAEMAFTAEPEVSEESQEKASAKAKQIMEGNDLIVSVDQAHQEAIAADMVAAEAEDTYRTSASEYVQAGSNEKRYLLLEKKLNSGKDLTPEEEEEMDRLEASGLNQRELRVARNKALRELNRQDKLRIEARGEKPKRDYEHEARLRNESEELQAEALKFAVEAVSMFPEDPAQITEQTVKDTNRLVRWFSENERRALSKLDEIKKSMSERFSADKDTYQTKYDQIVSDYNTAKEVIDKVLEREFDQVEASAQVAVVEEIALDPDLLIGTEITSADMKDIYGKVGITVEGDSAETANISMAEGSLAERVAQQQQLVDHLTSSYESVVKAVQENPQAVDRLRVLASSILIAQETLRAEKAKLKNDVLRLRTEKVKQNLAEKEEQRKNRREAARLRLQAQKAAERQNKRREMLNGWAQRGTDALQKVAEAVTHLSNQATNMRETWNLQKGTKIEETKATSESAARLSFKDASDRIAQIEGEIQNGNKSAAEIAEMLSEVRRLMAESDAA